MKNFIGVHLISDLGLKSAPLSLLNICKTIYSRCRCSFRNVKYKSYSQGQAEISDDMQTAKHSYSQGNKTKKVLTRIAAQHQKGW